MWATPASTIHDERHSRASFASPFNGYKADFFEGAQRAALCIGADAPLPDHQVRENEAVVLS
jgi:hypothetical protein